LSFICSGFAPSQSLPCAREGGPPKAARRGCFEQTQSRTLFFTVPRWSNPSVKNQRFLTAIFIEQLPPAIVYPNRCAILAQGSLGCSRTTAINKPFSLYSRLVPKENRDAFAPRFGDYFTIRLTSLFLTTMVLRISPPCFAKKAAIFSLARTLAMTASFSRSASITTVPRILPLT